MHCASILPRYVFNVERAPMEAWSQGAIIHQTALCRRRVYGRGQQ